MGPVVKTLTPHSTDKPSPPVCFSSPPPPPSPARAHARTHVHLHVHGLCPQEDRPMLMLHFYIILRGLPAGAFTTQSGNLLAHLN